MMRRVFLAALFLAAPLDADQPASADLTRARAAHAAELARLRQKLLDDIDAVVRQEKAAGAGIDYLLKERKGFADNGVTPILPKLLPAAEAYARAKGTADEALAGAVEAALKAAEADKRVDEAARLRAELAALRPAAPAAISGPETKEDLARALAGTVWAWPKGGELTLLAGGQVRHTAWGKLTVTWQAVSWRTVRLKIEKGEGAGKTAALGVDDAIGRMGGTDFDGSKLPAITRKK